MRVVNSFLMLVLAGGSVAGAQTSAPTPATQSSAPAAISPAATGSQAAGAAATASSATTSSQGSGARGGSVGSGTSNPGGAGSTGGGAPANGITGVPRYRAGFRGPAGTSAPKATAAIAVTGDADGDGKPDEKANLPGIASFRNGLKAGTPIQVRLQSPVDSGHAKNGDTLHGTLLAPVAGAPAGAPVELTVVAAAAAGQMSSAGELSVQVVRINGNPVLSEVVTATGEEGKKILPDAAPARGTEAIFTPDKPLTLPAA